MKIPVPDAKNRKMRAAVLGNIEFNLTSAAFVVYNSAGKNELHPPKADVEGGRTIVGSLCRQK